MGFESGRTVDITPFRPLHVSLSVCLHVPIRSTNLAWPSCHCSTSHSSAQRRDWCCYTTWRTIFSPDGRKDDVCTSISQDRVQLTSPGASVYREIADILWSRAVFSLAAPNYSMDCNDVITSNSTERYLVLSPQASGIHHNEQCTTTIKPALSTQGMAYFLQLIGPLVLRTNYRLGWEMSLSCSIRIIGVSKSACSTRLFSLLWRNVQVAC
jgi:hypothetical protein